MIGSLYIAISLQATAPFLDTEADGLRYPCDHTILRVHDSTSDQLPIGQHQSTFCFRIFIEYSSEACANVSTRSCTHSASAATEAVQRMVLQQALKPRIGEQKDNNRSAELCVPRTMSQQDTTLSGESCNAITIARSRSFPYYFLTDADQSVSTTYAISDRLPKSFALLTASAPAY